MAIAQAKTVVAALTKAHRGIEVEVVTITTSGDRNARPGDKSRFVKEIEVALATEEVDLAVHSAKDLPGEMLPELAIVAVPERADARDTLVGDGASLDGVPAGARVGTSSLRRRSQLLALRPDLNVRDLRGNVDTRLDKLANGDYDAIVVAAAGLARLGHEPESSFPIDPQMMVPAPGQGTLAIEARRNDKRTADLAAAITDPSTLACLTAERAIVSGLGATCHTSVGAYAHAAGGHLVLHAYAGSPDGSEWIRDQAEGDLSRASEIGRLLAERMISVGADRLLASTKAAG